jgi:hypothetical protein
LLDLGAPEPTDENQAVEGFAAELKQQLEGTETFDDEIKLFKTD